LAGEFVDTRHVTQRAADEVPGRETGLQSPVSEHGMSVSDRKDLRHSRDGRKTTCDVRRRRLRASGPETSMIDSLESSRTALS
jgi:hypothetical protein